MTIEISGDTAGVFTINNYAGSVSINGNVASSIALETAELMLLSGFAETAWDIDFPTIKAETQAFWKETNWGIDAGDSTGIGGIETTADWTS